MTPNCKPGELAEFIPGQVNAGRRVMVDRFAYTHSTGRVVWHVTALQPIMCAASGSLCMGPGLALDSQLRPVRDPGDDIDVQARVGEDRDALICINGG